MKPKLMVAALMASCIVTSTAMIVLALDSPGWDCLAFGGGAGWLLFIASDLL